MTSLKILLGHWHRFFFRPGPVDSIAVFRIIWGTLLLANLVPYLSNMEDFYGPHAIISLETVRQQFPYLHLNILHFFPLSYTIVYVVMAVYALSLLGVVLGFYTRASMIIAFICMSSLHHRNMWILNGSDLIMRHITILLICSPCGHAYSIDSLLGRKIRKFRKDKMHAPWAMRMIQLQTAAIYLCTVWGKIYGDYWFDGTAVYYATRIESFYNYPLPFVLDSKIMLALLTWGTLLIELALGTLIWFKEFRKPLIVLGTIFHLGIEYTMSIPYFELVMIALLFLFFTPAEVRSFVYRLRDGWINLINRLNVVESVKEKLIWVARG